MLEKRKPASGVKSLLPSSYLLLLKESCTEYFKDTLQDLSYPNAFFEASGEIYPDELLVSVSFQLPSRLTGIAMHMSADFHPKSDLQGLLEGCILGIEAGFLKIFTAALKKKEHSIFDASQELLEAYGLPFEWSKVKNPSKTAFFLRVDRSNVSLEILADQVLADFIETQVELETSL